MDKSIPPYGAHLLDFIGGIEALKGYDTIFRNNQAKLSKRVTAMTIAEVQKGLAGLVEEVWIVGNRPIAVHASDPKGPH